MNVSLSKISEARKHLALGRSLDAAARIVGVNRSDLDQALWKKIEWRNPRLKRPAGHH